MGFSFHIRLPSGTLKIKNAGRLRRQERNHEIPVWRIGALCFVWDSPPREKPKALIDAKDDERNDS